MKLKLDTKLGNVNFLLSDDPVMSYTQNLIFTTPPEINRHRLIY